MAPSGEKNSIHVTVPINNVLKENMIRMENVILFKEDFHNRPNRNANRSSDFETEE